MWNSSITSVGPHFNTTLLFHMCSRVYQLGVSFELLIYLYIKASRLCAKYKFELHTYPHTLFCYTHLYKWIQAEQLIQLTKQIRRGCKTRMSDVFNTKNTIELKIILSTKRNGIICAYLSLNRITFPFQLYFPYHSFTECVTKSVCILCSVLRTYTRCSSEFYHLILLGFSVS